MSEEEHLDRYACITRTVDTARYHVGTWEWAGFAKAENALDAAKELAIGCEGYKLDDFGSKTELVEQFIEDGYRFKVMKIETVIENHDL